MRTAEVVHVRHGALELGVVGRLAFAVLEPLAVQDLLQLLCPLLLEVGAEAAAKSHKSESEVVPVRVLVAHELAVRLGVGPVEERVREVEP